MPSFILCECDWDLGPMPPHMHIVYQRIVRDDGREFWAHGVLPQKGYTILYEIEELSFSVPWSELWKQYGA